MSRGKPSKNTQATSVMDEVIEKVEGEKLPLESWPTTTLREYRLYNEEATKQNKRLGMCRYKIKQCPPDLHPKQRIIFRRNERSIKRDRIIKEPLPSPSIHRPVLPHASKPRQRSLSNDAA